MPLTKLVTHSHRSRETLIEAFLEGKLQRMEQVFVLCTTYDDFPFLSLLYAYLYGSARIALR